MATTLNSVAGNTAITFLSGLVQAKNEGATLPPILDKIADLTQKGTATGEKIVYEAAKDQMNKNLAWIIVGVLTLFILIMIFKRR